MNKYFEMNWNTNKKANIFIEGFQISDRMDKFRDMGVTFKEEAPITAIIKNAKGIKADVIVGGSTLPIISEKFKEFITSFSELEYKNLEFIPVLFDPKHKLPNYYLMNILNNIPCFDYEKSVFSRLPIDIFPDQQHIVHNIQKVVLKDELVGQRNIFRIAEYRVPIYITEKLKNAMEEEGFTGFEFKEV